MRRRPLYAAPAAALVATLVVTTLALGSGSAAPGTKPYTASFAPTSVSAGPEAHITLTISNNADPQPLGSANVTAATSAAGTSLAITGSSSGTIDSSSNPDVLKLRNLNLAPDAELVVDITVTACVAGTYTWGIRAKQSNDFSGPPGNDFFDEGGNRTTIVTGECRLEWVTQPESANPNAIITGTPYTPSAASVAVKAVDGAGATLTSLDAGAVTLAKTAGTFTSSGGFSGTQATFADGVATFTSLKSSATGLGFKLTAGADGFASSPQSSAFDILAGTVCTSSGCQTPPLTSGTSFGQASTASGNFVFLGIGTLTGTSCNVPNFASVQGAGAAPIIVTEQRTSLSGELFVTYGLKKSEIQKRFGNNSGEQFVPICAGAKRLTLVGGATEALSCVSDGGGPWLGKALTADGRFSGATAPAVCDTTSGYWVGILGSHQDNTKGIDPSINPTVTGWNSDNTYRYFTIRYPSGSGSGALATVPWDGWQFG